MSALRIKDRVSRLVNSQLPEFIRSDYTTFVAFLEYYYQFLEQDQSALELVQNARQYSDIDQTASSFVNYFLTNYAKDLPHSLLVDKSLLIKRIKGLYAAKGSNLSIETLFQVLYDTSAFTRHPYDSVLKPSDGNWDQRTSIRVYQTTGSSEDITDRFLTFYKNNIKYSAAIVRVKNISTNLYEIFYNSRSNVPFEINTVVTVRNATSEIFSGIIQPTLTNYTLTAGGTGFTAGQVFNIRIAGGVDTLIRILKVSSVGAIERIKILNFGYGFTDDISIILSNSGGISARAKYLTTIGGGFIESVSVRKIHSITNPDRYFYSDYVDPFDYTGDTLASNTTTSQLLTSETTTGNESVNDAVINFYLGAIAKYPGEYTSTQGFLSEPDVRIQDDKLYQPFAYQIESELDITVFYDIVKKLVHQAGTNMFVNRALTTTASISSYINVIAVQNVSSEFNSVFSILENTSKLIRKTLDTDSVSTEESLAKTFRTTINNTDSTVSITESISGIQYTVDYVSGDYFSTVYVANPASGTVVI